jgi:hypothetical protein
MQDNMKSGEGAKKTGIGAFDEKMKKGFDDLIKMGRKKNKEGGMATKPATTDTNQTNQSPTSQAPPSGSKGKVRVVLKTTLKRRH